MIEHKCIICYGDSSAPMVRNWITWCGRKISIDNETASFIISDYNSCPECLKNFRKQR